MDGSALSSKSAFVAGIVFLMTISTCGATMLPNVNQVQAADFLGNWPDLVGKPVEIAGVEVYSATVDGVHLKMPGGSVMAKPPWANRDELPYLLHHCSGRATGKACIMSVIGIVRISDSGGGPELSNVHFRVLGK